MKGKFVFFAVTAVVVFSSFLAVQLYNRPKSVPEINYISSVSETCVGLSAEELPPIIFPLDINTATKEELILLDGVGDVLAERIVKFRNDGNYFYSTEELMLVSGIGEKILEKNKGKIYVNTENIPQKTISEANSEQSDIISSEAVATVTETTFSLEISESIETTPLEIAETTIGVEFPLDLNSASADELCFIDGIGPVLAERIIEYRNENIGFYSVDELLNVKGIGEKTLAQIENYVYADTSLLPPRETETEREAEETLRQRYSVNLNTATYDDLKQLGLSDRLVGNIIELREQIGYFTNTLELLYADGMTNEIYNSISGYVYI